MQSITKPSELKNKPDCTCKHKLTGTGAVFYQSLGWLYCANCKGVQPIRKPIDTNKE